MRDSVTWASLSAIVSEGETGGEMSTDFLGRRGGGQVLETREEVVIMVDFGKGAKK